MAKIIPSLRAVIPAALVFLLAVTISPVPAARAASLVVNTIDDENEKNSLCSLREAIIAANSNGSYNGCTATGFGNDTITFASNYHIILDESLPNVTDPAGLTVDGSGFQITINGDASNRIISISSTLHLRNLTMAGGNAEYGGAVQNLGLFTATGVKFVQNVATSDGGAIDNQIGATVHVRDSLFSLNSAAYYGGAIRNTGSLTVYDSTFESNTANYGGAIAVITPGLAEVSSSTFQDNQGSVNDGASAVCVYSGAADIRNSTFQGNYGRTGDAYTIAAGGSLTILSSTIAGNDEGVLGTDSGTVTLRNSILSNGTGRNCLASEDAEIIDGGNNIELRNHCGFLPANGSLANSDPLLGPLQDNGGTTFTMALLPGSPAINGVTWNAPNHCPFYDQRGIPRALAACDIGAYEKDAGFLVFLPLMLKG